MTMLKTKFVGGLTLREAAADARAVKAELAGKHTGRFKVVVVPRPASPAEVKATRKALHVTQVGFAGIVGVSARSVTSWERGIRRPDGVTSRLIRLLRRNPDFAQTWQNV
jgi:DNA-binding transcriptional regulator YiaG